jgi:hypothetical protein
LYVYSHSRLQLNSCMFVTARGRQPGGLLGDRKIKTKATFFFKGRLFFGTDLFACLRDLINDLKQLYRHVWRNNRHSETAGSR